MFVVGEGGDGKRWKEGIEEGENDERKKLNG
jgi:hypothetical protein